MSRYERNKAKAVDKQLNEVKVQLKGKTFDELKKFDKLKKFFKNECSKAMQLLSALEMHEHNEQKREDIRNKISKVNKAMQFFDELQDYDKQANILEASLKQFISDTEKEIKKLKAKHVEHTKALIQVFDPGNELYESVYTIFETQHEWCFKTKDEVMADEEKERAKRILNECKI